MVIWMGNKVWILAKAVGLFFPQAIVKSRTDWVL